MKKRGFLLVVTLASLSVILLTQFQVRPRLRRLGEQRDQYAQSLAQETDRRLALQRTLQQAQNTAAEGARLLQESQTALAASGAQLAVERARAAGLQEDLARTRADVAFLDRALARERGVGTQLTQLEAKNAALAERNAALAKRVAQLEDIVGPFPPPPPDLRAKVKAVDPKWGFVILDIGRTHQAKPTWHLLVHRGGVLVGKVEITTVLEDHCVANLLPGWGQGEVCEGDAALPELLVASRAPAPAF
jgi:hypothetical protein